VKAAIMFSGQGGLCILFSVMPGVKRDSDLEDDLNLVQKKKK
jgi:hypothetical protein